MDRMHLSDNPNRCVVCGAEVDVRKELPSAIPAVTSDCRPWPPGRQIGTCGACGLTQRVADIGHDVDIAEIYREYSMFSHASVAGDQKSFFEGVGTGRTGHILAHFEKVVESISGPILDIGSGSGAGLAAIGAAFPEAPLDGLEPFDDPAGRLAGTVSSLRQVHRDWSDLSDKYGLVTMFHVLEHLSDPLGRLRQVRDLMADGGYILIEVPYFPDNPFDFMVADHISHFRRIDVANLLQIAGFGIISISTDVVRKEITAIAMKDGVPSTIANDDVEAVGLVGQQLNWLRLFIAHVQECKKKYERLGVYGTGPVAAWISALIEGDVEFFVDDDPDRQGTTFHNQVVLPVERSNPDTPIYLGFVPSLATLIHRRRAGDGRKYLIPPAMSFVTGVDSESDQPASTELTN